MGGLVFGRNLCPHFQGKGAHHWMSGRRNGLARGIITRWPGSTIRGQSGVKRDPVLRKWNAELRRFPRQSASVWAQPRGHVGQEGRRPRPGLRAERRGIGLVYVLAETPRYGPRSHVERNGQQQIATHTGPQPNI